MENLGAILERKLSVLFPDAAEREAVQAELDRYGTESYEQGVDRVRLAVIRLAGGSLEEVRRQVDIAKRDFRDTLAMAEYPAQLVAPTWRMPPEEVQRLVQQDFEQYRRWLEED